MKKTKFFFLTLLAGLLMSVDAWGYNHPTPLSYTDFVNLAGTGKRFGIQAVSDNAATYDLWFGFTNASGMSRVKTLTKNQLFILTGNANAAQIQRCSDSKYLSGANSFGSTAMDVKLVNRAGGDYSSEYTKDMQVSIDNAAGAHYNANGYNFGSGTGGWSAYVTFGPYYIADIECEDENGDPLAEATTDQIVLEGYVPTFAGYSLVSGDAVTADGKYTFVYRLAEMTYNIHIDAPAGTTVAINGTTVTDGDTYKKSGALDKSEVTVTPPESYYKSTVTISGTEVYIKVEDGRWAINFSKDQKYTRSDRHINGISLMKSDGSDEQKLENLWVNQSTTTAYIDLTKENKKFTFVAGTEVKPKFYWTGSWMHGFVYIDYNNDGIFTVSEVVAENELVSYDTQILNNSPVKPAFTLPNTPGTYRIRYKVDWSSTDPAGNLGNEGSPTGSNGIITNGGSITDAWLVIEDASSMVNITYQVLGSDESVIWSKTVSATKGEAYPAVSNPNPFVTLGGFPTGTVSKDETITLTYTSKYDCFDAPASVTQWYALDMHSNQGHKGTPLYYKADDDTYVRCEFIDNNTPTDDFKNGAVKSENFAWAFIGNPFTGVKLYNKVNQKYVSQPSDDDVKVQFSETGDVFQIFSGSGSIANSFVLKVNGRNNYLNHREKYIQGWTSADEGSSFRAWAITPATAADAVEYTFNADYGTLIVPFYAEIPEDVEVYTCSALSGNVLTLTAETSMIKPGVPYIIKSEPSSEFEFLGGTKLTTPATTTVGLLTGVYASTALNDIISSVGENKQAYVLTQADRVVFQYLEGDYGTATIGANRCFITLDKPETPAEVKTTLFFDEETGINDVDVDVDVDGKFLENGKIVIVKNNAKYNVAGQMMK